MVVAEVPGGAHVVLHVPSGTYLRLEGSAPAIIELLGRHTVEEAAQELAARYDVSIERAFDDVAVVASRIDALRPLPTSRPRRPTARGVLTVGRQWWDLPGGYRWATFRAGVVLAFVEASLRRGNIERVSRMLGVPLAWGGPVPDEEAEPMVMSAAERRDQGAAAWALARWPYPDTCLRRALLLGVALRRRRPVLRLGVVGGGTTAHAWIEVAGRAYGMGEVAAVFRPVG